ncbi:MAG: NAD-dependent epimerase/dehydratase family protein [Deltaproteobacteria bacterium]|nr:MAG: NAD-dependent epimerase/dehydratase family protein [Deltaproteobacteria bacterium]
MTPTTILVTGGAGFVGSTLALHLKRHDVARRVIALDNLKRRGSELNVPRLRDGGVEFVHGDIRCPEDLDVAETDLLLECSAEPSVLAGYDSSPQYLVNTNLLGTLNLLEHCRRRGAAIVFLSTSRVYPMAALAAIRLDETPTRFEIAGAQTLAGISARGISEEFPLSGARSLYGATKLASELFIEEYAYAYGLRAVVDRCGVLAGPWQMGKVDQGFVALWVARHLFEGRLSYIGFGGSGKQVRDVLHVDDLCDLVTRQIARLDDVAGQVFNVGGGRRVSTSLCELTELCRRVTGKTIAIDAVAETRTADVPLYVTDTARIEATLGWSPTRDLERVVVDTHDWMHAHAASLRAILS